MQRMFLLFTVFIFIGCGMMGNPKKEESPILNAGTDTEDSKYMDIKTEISFENVVQFASSVVNDFYLIKKIEENYGDFEKKSIDKNHSIVTFSSNYIIDTVLVYSQSKVSINDNIYTLDIKGIENNISFTRQNLKYKVTQGSISSFLLMSGLSNDYFWADLSKKNIQKAFEVDQHGDLLSGGVFYYKVNPDKSLILQTTDINEITVKFDINSDKIFDENESLVLKIKGKR